MKVILVDNAKVNTVVILSARLLYAGFEENGKVYTVTIMNTKTAILFPIIREQVKPDSIVYTDYYHSYDVLNDKIY